MELARDSYNTRNEVARVVSDANPSKTICITDNVTFVGGGATDEILALAREHEVTLDLSEASVPVQDMFKAVLSRYDTTSTPPITWE